MLVPHPGQDVPVHQARGDAECLHAQINACVNTGSIGLTLSAAWLSTSDDLQQALVSLLHQRLAQSRGFVSAVLSSMHLRHGACRLGSRD